MRSLGFSEIFLGGVLVLPFVAGVVSIGAAPSMTAACDIREGRVYIPSGMVLLHEDGTGRPGELTQVPAFWLDRHEVTNMEFAAFVAATGYTTASERQGESAVFIAPTPPVSLHNPGSWWKMVRRVNWRHPEGPDSDLTDRENEPVVHVAREDAKAYAKWVGGDLPTVEQWERAARGNQHSAREPVSWAFSNDGAAQANVWEGPFPVHDTADDGYAGIAPVGCFPANDFGLHDMIGNVWEWVEGEGSMGMIKGGSYLCSMNYCANFRPAGYQAQEQDFGTNHIGFRVAYAEKTVY